jgi:DNA-binding XRE family transcriptional regulator
VNKEKIIQVLSEQFKLVRTEFDYHQVEMAAILGISKKTLVQIEKGRQVATWIQIVSLCALFQNSTILQNVLGGNPLEVLQTIAHTHFERQRPKTLGGKVWWMEKEKQNGFVLQKNVITNHYRILDHENRRWDSSFDKDFIYERFKQRISSKE